MWRYFGVEIDTVNYSTYNPILIMFTQQMHQITVKSFWFQEIQNKIRLSDYLF